MFLEACGKFFFFHMRPFFFFILLASPLLFSIFFLFSKVAEVQDLENSFYSSLKKGKIALERKARKERFLTRYTEYSPYFLDENLECLQFLQKEQSRLEALIQHPAFSNTHLFQDRLRFLRSRENRLEFQEEEIKNSAKIKETLEKQRHPIQLGETDLKKMLAVVEDVPIEEFLPIHNSPQLLVRQFRMKIIQSPFKNRMFEVELDLLKREFHR